MPSIDDKLKELVLEPIPLEGPFIPYSNDEVAVVEDAIGHSLRTIIVAS